MTPALTAAVARVAGAEVRAARSVSGGCIHLAEWVDLADGRAVFVKSNADPLPGVFAREAEGLAALAATGALRVPAVLAVGDAPVPHLVLEAIAPGTRRPDHDAVLGRGLALLHRATAERYGFPHDNWLGSTPQPNAWSDDWVAFWRERRLEPLFAAVRRVRGTDAAFDRAGHRLLDRLGTWLAAPADPPSLLHGDLWEGNVLVAETGEPVILDPAVYYGRREAELAMPTLFGGFGPGFFAAYQEVWPLASGWEERQPLYQLYHLLNHLLIFGEGYRGRCLAVLQRFGG